MENDILNLFIYLQWFGNATFAPLYLQKSGSIHLAKNYSLEESLMNYPQSRCLFSDEIHFSHYIVFVVSIEIRAKTGLYLGSVLKALVF